jgi:dTDP-glucose 4,6-dehydratase
VVDRVARDAPTSGLAGLNRPWLEYIEGDVTDLELVRDAMHGVSRVVHLAAESHTDKSYAAPIDFAVTNAVGTTVVAVAAAEAEVPYFVAVSSDHVYGQADAGAIAETAPLRVRSPYAASKAAGDLMVLSLAATGRLPGAVVRLGNVFGPWQLPDKMISLFITKALEGHTLPVYGDGTAERDWIYVDDCCDAIWRVLDAQRPGEVFNVQSGHAVTNEFVAATVCDLVGVERGLIRHVYDTRGPDGAIGIDVAPIRKLGWRPTVSFLDQLQTAIGWYRDHRSWWLPLARDLGHPADRFRNPD